MMGLLWRYALRQVLTKPPSASLALTNLHQNLYKFYLPNALTVLFSPTEFLLKNPQRVPLDFK